MRLNAGPSKSDSNSACSRAPQQPSRGVLRWATSLTRLESIRARHCYCGTYTKTGLTGPDELTPAKVMAYVREQVVSGNKVPKTRPPVWLNFIAVGGNRCRFIGAYENQGEAVAERTETRRFYDLLPSPCLASFQDRLVIDWAGHAINWAKRGEATLGFHVIEIADAQAPAFPGFDELILSFSELQSVIEDSRYASWRQVLKAV